MSTDRGVPRRRSTRMALVISFVLAGVVFGSSPAMGSCAAASVVVMAGHVAEAPSYPPTATAVVQRDGKITVIGFAWGTECNDVQGPGCNSPPLGEPVEEVDLWLSWEGSPQPVPGELRRPTLLGTAHPMEDWDFAFPVNFNGFLSGSSLTGSYLVEAIGPQVRASTTFIVVDG